MAFLDDESGSSSGNPVELFTITTPQATYRYVAGPVDFTYDAQVYTRAAISRESIKSTVSVEREELIVTLPVTMPVVETLGIFIAPRTCSMTIRRLHVSTGNHQVIWSGRIVSLSVAGRTAKLVSLSPLADSLEAQIPPRSFQSVCNNQLFDDRCRLARSNYDFAGVVASISGLAVTLVTGAGSPSTGTATYYKAGEMVRDSDGERRLIVGQSGDTLTLNYPFRVLEVGDAVTIYAGCDGLVTTCKDKFNNVVNFTGHPMMPRSNLWTRHLGTIATDEEN